MKERNWSSRRERLKVLSGKKKNTETQIGEDLKKKNATIPDNKRNKMSEVMWQDGWFECTRFHWKVSQMSRYALIHNTALLWCYCDVTCLFSSRGSPGMDVCPWESVKSVINLHASVLTCVSWDTCLGCQIDITSFICVWYTVIKRVRLFMRQLCPGYIWKNMCISLCCHWSIQLNSRYIMFLYNYKTKDPCFDNGLQCFPGLFGKTCKSRCQNQIKEHNGQNTQWKGKTERYWFFLFSIMYKPFETNWPWASAKARSQCYFTFIFF